MDSLPGLVPADDSEQRLSNKVLIVMWQLSFEAATVYAVLNCYHFIGN